MSLFDAQVGTGESLRAMVLAAGFGSRLSPLTDLVPKPLIPVANRPLIEYVLSWLAKSKVTKMAINLHHLGNQIRTVLNDGSRFGCAITYSSEEPILGTGGGLVRMRSFFQGATFLVVNADVLTVVDLSQVLRFHRERKAAATMVVRPFPEGCSYTRLGLDEEGWLVEFKSVRQQPRGKVRPVMFCGVHVLEPVIFDFLPPEGFSCLNSEGYLSMMAGGRKVAGFLDQGPWFDLGTPIDYLSANRAVLAGRVEVVRPPQSGCANAEGVLLGQGVEIGRDVRLGPEVAVGDGCVLGDGSRIARSVIWPGTVVQPGSELEMAVATAEYIVREPPP